MDVLRMTNTIPHSFIRVLIACVCAAALPPLAMGDVQTRPFEFESSHGTMHDAQLLLPAEDDRNDFAILMLGGGSLTDMHWTIPGVAETANGPLQFTIDGEPTRDGETLARAFSDAGFIVMQWSGIHQDDERHKANPAMLTPIPYPDTVTLARDALNIMREQDEINTDNIILVGHSLGATRACQIMDDNIKGVVMISGAYIARIGVRPSDVSDAMLQRWAAVDSNNDAHIDPDEFAARNEHGSAPTTNASFDMLDFDGDDLLSGWELGAGEVLGSIVPVGPIPLPEQMEFREGARWAIDMLLEHRETPVFAIYGGADPIALHGPVVAEITRLVGRPDTSIEYAPELGHHLSIEQDDKVGPIDQDVVERIVTWLTATYATPADD